MESPAGPAPDLRVDFVPGTPAEPGDETFVLERNGLRRTFRLHDYDEVYAVPGLYEHVVQQRLGCTSPQTLAEALAARADAAGVPAADVRCLDVGAGNGVSGDALRAVGLTPVVGLDISPVARAAAQRDRPGLYADYVVGGLADVSPGELVARHRLTALVGAGALTGGHIEAQTLADTWAAFGPGSWLAFTCPEQHADEARTLFAAARFELDERFVHRYRSDGATVPYRVLVARHT